MCFAGSSPSSSARPSAEQRSRSSASSRLFSSAASATSASIRANASWVSAYVRSAHCASPVPRLRQVLTHGRRWPHLRDAIPGGVVFRPGRRETSFPAFERFLRSLKDLRAPIPRASALAATPLPPCRSLPAGWRYPPGSVRSPEGLAPSPDLRAGLRRTASAARSSHWCGSNRASQSARRRAASSTRCSLTPDVFLGFRNLREKSLDVPPPSASRSVVRGAIPQIALRGSARSPRRLGRRLFRPVPSSARRAAAAAVPCRARATSRSAGAS